jgi:hypothetical protein
VCVQYCRHVLLLAVRRDLRVLFGVPGLLLLKQSKQHTQRLTTSESCFNAPIRTGEPSTVCERGV